jgi:hypothetical protein
MKALVAEPGSISGTARAIAQLADALQIKAKPATEKNSLEADVIKGELPPLLKLGQ